MTESKYESLLERIAKIKQEGAKLRDEIKDNPTLHKVIEAKLEKLEADFFECGQEFVKLAGLEADFEKFQKRQTEI